MGRDTTANACIKCGGKTRVVDARPTANGDVRRRRECTECSARYSTLEILAGPHERCNEIAAWASQENRDMALREGQQVEFEVTQGPKGDQASNVKAL